MSRASLGQHFLINKDKLREIADALDLKFGETVIEIGPGHGELTDELRRMNHELKIIAIEKDGNLAELLKEKFAVDKNVDLIRSRSFLTTADTQAYRASIRVEIIEGDALKILPELIRGLKNKNFKIVGNIPYYITGYLLRIFGELENKPSLVVLLIQKEVAERICPPSPGLRRTGAKSWKMNLLAASVQFWAEPEIVGYVPRKNFQPAPEVDSAIIKLTTKGGKRKVGSEKYYEFIKILFRQPRKTILNNLKPKTKNLKPEDLNFIIQKIESIGVNPQDRPQDLSVEEIKKLAESLEKYIIQ